MLKTTRLVVLPLLFLLDVTSVQAGDPTDPVKQVMDIEVSNWKQGSTDSVSVLDDPYLEKLFTADFVAAYREASKHPAYDLPEGQTTGSPFDYDPIINGQDSCPIEDLRIEDDGDGQVTALYNNTKCMEGVEQVDQTIIFHVKQEGGAMKIDDLFHVIQGESNDGLKEQMQAIAKQ